VTEENYKELVSGWLVFWWRFERGVPGYEAGVLTMLYFNYPFIVNVTVTNFDAEVRLLMILCMCSRNVSLPYKNF
jgi:hypothetical protein